MTASELFAIVKEPWWKAIRLDGLYTVVTGGTDMHWVFNLDRIPTEVAEMIFEASAVRWLLEHGVFLTAYKSTGRYVLTASGGDRAVTVGRFDGATHIEALDAAIRSIANA